MSGCVPFRCRTTEVEYPKKINKRMRSEWEEFPSLNVGGYLNSTGLIEKITWTFPKSYSLVIMLLNSQVSHSKYLP